MNDDVVRTSNLVSFFARLQMRHHASGRRAETLLNGNSKYIPICYYPENDLPSIKKGATPRRSNTMKSKNGKGIECAVSLLQSLSLSPSSFPLSTTITISHKTMSTTSAVTATILAQVILPDNTSSSDGGAAKHRLQRLHKALEKYKTTTNDSTNCCSALSKRAHHLDSLTSPASDASAMLSQAASNLGSTLVKLKDARDKFETVRDCEPAIDRLRDGVRDMEDTRLGSTSTTKSRRSKKTSLNTNLSEQDVYAAADSMEILKDAFDFFLSRKNWRSTPSALQQIERVHKLGVSSMCTLITSHLLSAGQAIHLKRASSKGNKDGPLIPTKGETAEQVSVYSILLSFSCHCYTQHAL